MGNDTVIESLYEKIDDLNQQAWEVRVTDLPRSFELSQEAVKLARSISYPRGLAEGLRSLGFAHVRFSNNEEAAPLLKESLSLFQSLNDLKGQAVIYEYLGIIERNWGNLGASLDLLLKANEMVLQTGPPEVEITCSYQLGVTYKHLGNHENALDYLYKTLSLAKKINFPLMEAYATNIIGSIYFDNGNYNQALICYQQGLPIRQQSHDKWGEAGSLDNIGFTYLKLNDLDKAIEYCKQSLAICQDTGDKKGEANALLHLGEIYEKAGDVKQAASFSNESLEIRKARGDKRGETEVLLFLADLHKSREDVEDHQIFEWLSDALKIAAEIKAQDFLSKAYYDLHEYYQLKGNFKESLVQLEAHFQIEKELHKNSINQKVASLEISHKAEVVSQRNKELTELNEKIEKANEELKIERSLERVRTAAMAMKEPADMLKVCKIISNQLEILDVKRIRNVQTAIFYEEKGVYMNYEYYAKHDQQLITEVNYNNHPVAEKFANQMLKGPNEVFIHGFTGKEVRDWLDYQKTTNVFIDTYLETADSLNYYWYSLGPVALGMSAYVPLNESEIDLFKRFRNVFELAYRRYLDIEKAEAQAREAQIELALERVRARTMAMHHSGELADTASVLFQQIKQLGFETWSCGFCTWTIDDVAEVWMAADSGGLLPPMMIPYKEELTHSRIYEASLRGETAYDKVWEGKELERHYAFLKTIPSVKEAIDILETSGLSLPSRQCYYVGFFKQGYLLLITKEPNADLKDLSRRFARVFEQTYTRFLDLQKAEAQAREAQIEVALERARTQSMIMQHSKELDDTLRVFHEQVLLLGIKSAFSFLWLPDEHKERHIFWAAWVENVSPDPLAKKDSAIFNSKAINYPLDRNEPATAQCLVDWKGKEPVVSYHVPSAGVVSYFAAWRELISGVEQLKPEYFSNGLYYVEAFMKYGCFGVMVATDLTEDEKKILLRFTIEFERTYTRFLDLQKAEAQAREAQIEAALERVRSKTMAMQRSEELDSVIKTVYSELKHLDVSFDRCFIMIFDEQKGATWWMGSPEDELFHEGFYVHYHTHPPHLAYLKGWEERQQKWEYRLGGQIKKDWDEFLFYKTGLSKLPPIAIQYMKSFDAAHLAASFENFGCMTTGGQERLSVESFSILSRFAKVFDQTYTRFNDLKQAEAQAREAQIEAALEKVRANVMAMTSSKDLNETSLVFGEQLRKLNIDWQFSYFWLIDEPKNQNTFWITWPDYKTSITSYTLAEAEQYFNDCLISWRAGVKIHDNYVPPEGVQEWLDTFQRVADDAGGEAKRIMVFNTFSRGVYYYDAMMKYGSFGICISKPATEEEKNIQCRFAIEFERAYTRFLDLKQAEEQAREAKIEAALERVRAKAMAMHKSDDLKPAVAKVFEELDKLNLGLIRCGIAILDKEKPRGDIWITIKSDHGSTIGVSGDESLDIHPLLKGAYDAWLKLEDFSYVLQNDDLASYYQAITKTNFQQPVSATFTIEKKDQQQYYFNAVFQDGSLFAFLDTAFTDEAKMVMKRFANVFNLTYKRFLDLQKAEAQARESQIEVALERVRSRSMAMHKSDELREVVAVLFAQLQHLGFDIKFCTIALIDKINSTVEFWLSGFSQEILPESYHVPDLDHPFYRNFQKTFREGIAYKVFELTGEEKRSYDKLWFTLTDFKNLPEPVKRPMMEMEKVVLSCAFTKNGMLQIGGFEPLSDTDAAIIQRFAKVFEQTYTRFLDLQKAEEQAREALIEAALERVRARALAMQQPDELKDVAHVLRTEMGLLGVEELETCSIYINDDSPEKAECWYALKDISSKEKKLVNDHFVLDLNDTWVGRAMLQFYESTQKKVSIVMQGDNRKEWIRYCEERSAPLRGYYGQVIPDRTYHLYKFSHGAIGAAAAGEISEESWRMLNRAASVFSLAYSRFKDLTQARTDLIKLKEEKKRAEDALTELQATQKQLIQSEKMASLGELTAGIAHEIQNPLNFVNNFSDVSNELLEEMKAELERGNSEGAKEIAIDVKENLEKILHHGKRADAIVKGMLQHSRSSGGQKELTDINTLTEEYIRLAYHGLRAKDKFFNARFETDLDPSITKINIVPQEIGRVILNMINNSFYAVSEKKKAPPPPEGGIRNSQDLYEPTIKVKTSLNPPSGGRGAEVVISIKDNGIGIPKKALDKIFQPFFTTKPTGQGTGLGLSLSYDIVTQGHDGEIKVETKEGEGSEFIITLPMN